MRHKFDPANKHRLMDAERGKLLHRILRPGGWLAIIEWQKKETEPGPPLHERLSPEDAQEKAACAGFKPELIKILNEFHYLQVVSASALRLRR